jgi:hypothetical protein
MQGTQKALHVVPWTEKAKTFASPVKRWLLPCVCLPGCVGLL